MYPLTYDRIIGKQSSSMPVAIAKAGLSGLIPHKMECSTNC